MSQRLPQLGIDVDHEVEYYIKVMNRTGVDKVLVYCNPNESVAEMIKPHRDRFIPFATINLGDGKSAVPKLDTWFPLLDTKESQNNLLLQSTITLMTSNFSIQFTGKASDSCNSRLLAPTRQSGLLASRGSSFQESSESRKSA